MFVKIKSIMRIISIGLKLTVSSLLPVQNWHNEYFSSDNLASGSDLSVAFLFLISAQMSCTTCQNLL